jgi:tetratricopeptide (TPR) repeat protein
MTEQVEAAAHSANVPTTVERAVFPSTNGKQSAPKSPTCAWCPLGDICEPLCKIHEAVARLHQALRAEPTASRIHSDLGVVFSRHGHLEPALLHFRRAVELDPKAHGIHNNLGIALARKGDRQEAIAHYRRALQLKPNFPQAHFNLGNVLHQMGERDQAAGHYEQALKFKPDDFETRFRLGALRLEQERAVDAVTHLREARRLRPDAVDALNQLGIALFKQGQPEEAAAVFEEALRLRPNAPGIRNNYGMVLFRLGRYPDAADQYRRSLRLEPGNAGTISNLANTLREQGLIAEALLWYEEALRVAPQAADVHNNLGITFVRSRHLDQARHHYSEALRLQPDFPEARLNRAHLRLLEGDYEHGWVDYESRWLMKDAEPFRCHQELWDGSLLVGRTILLHWEQGMGDTLQFVRFVPLVKDKGGRVILTCQPRLFDLLSRCKGFDQLIRHGDPLPEFDVHAPLATLPKLLGITVETIPADVPYLFAAPAQLEHWRRELPPGDTLKVGIAWQGNPRYGGDRHRSIPLVYFLPLARIPGVQMYSLQKSDGADQLQSLAPGTGILDLAARLDERGGAFMDTAAALKNLDLVITCDTSIGHLAGGLGVPVWTLLSFNSDWRWMLDRHDSPWYPTIRLFRQQRPGDWAEVFMQVADALRQVASHRGVLHLQAPLSVGELLDRITVLMVKRSRLKPSDQLRQVNADLTTLVMILNKTVPPVGDWPGVTEELRAVNEILWDAEEALRHCEERQDFGPEFVEVTRRMLQTRQRRAAVLRLIDQKTGVSGAQTQEGTVQRPIGDGTMSVMRESIQAAGQ